MWHKNPSHFHLIPILQAFFSMHLWSSEAHRVHPLSHTVQHGACQFCCHHRQHQMFKQESCTVFFWVNKKCLTGGAPLEDSVIPMQLCPLHGIRIRWSLISLFTQAILWYTFITELYLKHYLLFHGLITIELVLMHLLSLLYLFITLC